MSMVAAFPPNDLALRSRTYCPIPVITPSMMREPSSSTFAVPAMVAPPAVSLNSPGPRQLNCGLNSSNTRLLKSPSCSARHRRRRTIGAQERALSSNNVLGTERAGLPVSDKTIAHYAIYATHQCSMAGNLSRVFSSGVSGLRSRQ